MTVFGDDEPEDAWDAGDPPVIKLGNIARRIALLRAGLDAVATPRERLRFEQIDEDLAHVIAELVG